MSNDAVAKGGLGVLGLKNLGNTCFMNTALQCILATDLFTSYFQQNEELFNTLLSSNSNNNSNGHSSSSSSSSSIMSNPLRRRQQQSSDSNMVSGNNMQVSTAFYQLIHQFVKADCNRPSPIAPQELKFVVAKNAPWLIGNQQHDCQEFLRYLLDALSEELKSFNKKKIKEHEGDGAAAAVSHQTRKNSSSSGRGSRLRLLGGRSRNQSIEDNDEVVIVENDSSNSGGSKVVAVMKQSTSPQDEEGEEESLQDEKFKSSTQNNLVVNNSRSHSTISNNSNSNNNNNNNNNQRNDALKECELEIKESNQRWDQCFTSNATIVEQCFQGQLRSRIECCVCKHVSFCFDPFLDISVPIPESAKHVEKRERGGGGGGGVSSSSRAPSCSLEECLKCFTETEVGLFALLCVCEYIFYAVYLFDVVGFTFYPLIS
jgi:hypothetical protein